MTEEEVLGLFERYHNDIYRLAVSYTGSSQDSEDIVQTVFLKLWEKQPALMPGKEKAWLIQVAINQCRNLLKAPWRKRRNSLETAELFSWETPEESELFRAIMDLPEEERVTVHLYYFEGYTLREIGRMMHITPSAVSMRLHRARKRLKSVLKEEEDLETAISEPV